MIRIFDVNKKSGTTYFVSSTLGSDSNNGLSPSTPWRTINKVNGSLASMGGSDSVLFKCGDTFTGATLTLTKDGTSTTSRFNVGSYSFGPKPKLSTLVPVTGWVSIGGNKYQATIASGPSRLDVVMINDTFIPVVRYPKITDANNGFLAINSTNGSTSIVTTSLTSVTQFIGAEVVVKPDVWIIDRDAIVTGQTTTSGGTTFLFTRSPYLIANTSGAASIKQNWTYFLQNHPNMLTQNGEWCYTGSTIIMYSSTGTPTNVFASIINQNILVSGSNRRNISISNLELIGGKTGVTLNTIVNGSSINNITIDNCDFNYCSDAISVLNGSKIIVRYNNVKNSINNGILVRSFVGNDNIVENNYIENTGMIYGMANTINSCEAISVVSPTNQTTTNCFVRNNVIINTGYNGIRYNGSGILIEKNKIDGFCLIKDDGGAIYSFNSSTPGGGGVTLNRTIRNNIILNGFGTTLGKSPTSSVDVEAIYQDMQVRDVNIFDNTIINCRKDVFYNNYIRNIIITGNTCFNNDNMWLINRKASVVELSGNQITNNVFVTTGGTIASFYDFNVTTSIQDSISKIPTVNNNFYYTPTSTVFDLSYTSGSTTYFPIDMGYQQYKLFTGLETNSEFINYTPYVVNSLIGSNLYSNSGFTSLGGIVCFPVTNPTGVVSIDNTSKISGTTSLRRDVVATGVTSNDNRLNLIYDFITGPVSTSKKYIIRFSLFSNSNYGWLNCRLRTSTTYLSNNNVKTFTSGLTQFEFLVEPTTSAATGTARWEIALNLFSGTVWIDNLTVFEANVTKNNFSDNFIMLYNDTEYEKIFDLGISNWMGYPEKVVYDKSVTLQPFTSKIFVKV